MQLKHEFVLLAQKPHANFAQLCRRFAISRKTGYKWLRRYRQGGHSALHERSRKPHHSPRRTPAPIETTVLKLRKQHPAWGGRKLRRRLLDLIAQHKLALRPEQVPAASTITAILHRHQLITPEASEAATCWRRFEAQAPNHLWQMDFKGDVLLHNGQRCYPLTLLDDHSRFALALQVCPNQRRQSVQTALTTLFRRYGLPVRMTMDNGSPWGAATTTSPERVYTGLELWLIRLGIRVGHSRPYHPQTQGKLERLHRTLEAEVLRYGSFAEMPACQRALDRWRRVYNYERPHEALALAVPHSRYQVSPRSYPEPLPALEYGEQDHVRKADVNGWVSFQGYAIKLGRAFAGLQVGFRSRGADASWSVYYCHECVKRVDLRTYTKV